MIATQVLPFCCVVWIGKDESHDFRVDPTNVTPALARIPRGSCRSCGRQWLLEGGCDILKCHVYTMYVGVHNCCIIICFHQVHMFVSWLHYLWFYIQNIYMYMYRRYVNSVSCGLNGPLDDLMTLHYHPNPGGCNYQTEKFPKKWSSNIITSFQKSTLKNEVEPSVEPFQVNERSSNSSLGIIVICPLLIHIAINIVKVVYDILTVC